MLYTIVFFIHVIAAVMGLGAAFGFPIVAKSAQNVTQAKFVLPLLGKLEVIPKTGSILLLLSGLVMAIIETSLFTTGWFIASIAIYIAVQFVVAGIQPKIMKRQLEVVKQAETDTFPPEYYKLAQKAKKCDYISHSAVLILILLMVFKPF